MTLYDVERTIKYDRSVVTQSGEQKLGNRKILEDVSFTVEQGNIFGYLGPNGAGKTTTIGIIMGLFRANSGTVQVLGENTSPDKLRRKIGFVLEYDGLYDNLTAGRIWNSIFNFTACRKPVKIK